MRIEEFHTLIIKQGTVELSAEAAQAMEASIKLQTNCFVDFMEAWEI